MTSAVLLLDEYTTLLDSADTKVYMVGNVYGGYDSQADCEYSPEDIKIRITQSCGDIPTLCEILRLSVGPYYLVVCSEESCIILTSIGSAVFYTFQNNTLLISSSQNIIFSYSAGNINIELAFLYVLKQIEGLHHTFFTDCFVVPSATIDHVSLNSKNSLSRKCILYQYYLQKFSSNTQKPEFERTLDAVGRIYASATANRPVTVALSGVDSANAALSMLNGKCSMDGIIADNYPLQTAVAKSIAEALANNYLFRGLRLVDGGLWRREIDIPFFQEIEDMYCSSLYHDYSACHTVISFMKALPPSTFIVKGDMLSTGRTANLHHTSLYKASFYKSHIFGFWDRAVYTKEFFFLNKLQRKPVLKSIVSTFAFPGARFDSDYRQIVKHQDDPLFQTALSIYQQHIMSEIECDLEATGLGEQMFNVQYIITKVRYFISALAPDKFSSALYGIIPVNVFADGPGAACLLSHYRLSLWNAFNPKEVVYRYYKRKTGISFRQTVRRILQQLNTEQKRGFTDGFDWSGILPRFFLRPSKYLTGAYYCSRWGKLKKSILKRFGIRANQASPPQNAASNTKEIYSAPSAPLIHNYMRSLWSKYNSALDLRTLGHDPIIRNYFEKLATEIETQDIAQVGARDRFVNLTVYLSHFLKQRSHQTNKY